MTYIDQGSSSRRIPEVVELSLHIERLIKDISGVVQVVSTALNTMSSTL